MEERESSLKYMTRSLGCMIDGEGTPQLIFFSHAYQRPFSGYATASVEGRIAVEYFDPSPEIQDKKVLHYCSVWYLSVLTSDSVRLQMS